MSEERQLTLRRDGEDSCYFIFMALKLVLNGNARVFEALTEASTLEDLVKELGLKGDRIAVEHNGEIAPRQSWSAVGLSENDRLEVVHFVGGGS
ncbi:MAG TPA: sulfur carrier protein ThiS [Edaphobacter sp.]|nr:sulfur carrier protein ThiS [Edaphobacter sp.]